MADYYCEFSATLDDLTPEQTAWLEGELNGDGAAYEIEENESWPGFEWEVIRREGEAPSLWVHDEQSGNREHLGRLIQAFLKKFRPKDSFGFEVAYTCSKPRGDGFGGGAMFITADGIETIETSEWLDRQSRVHKTAGEAGPVSDRGTAREATLTTVLEALCRSRDVNPGDVTPETREALDTALAVLKSSEPSARETAERLIEQAVAGQIDVTGYTGEDADWASWAADQGWSAEKYQTIGYWSGFLGAILSLSETLGIKLTKETVLRAEQFRYGS